VKISDIRIQKRNRNRFSIYVDGRYRFSLDEQTLGRAGFHIGDEIDEETIRNLSSKDEFFRARDYGMLLLSYRDRSEQEFRKRLLDRAHNRDVVEEVIELFKAENLINDQVFAEKWIEHVLHSRPMGALRVRHELRARFVDDQVIDSVVGRMLGRDMERDLAHAAAEKKMRALKGYAEDKVRSRLQQHLRNRGFQFDIIHDVMKEFIRDDIG
jgi:regulatory protein